MGEPDAAFGLELVEFRLEAAGARPLTRAEPGAAYRGSDRHAIEEDADVTEEGDGELEHRRADRALKSSVTSR